MRYHTNASKTDYRGQTSEIYGWIKKYCAKEKNSCVYLITDDNNKFDVNAIKVVNPHGRLLGFVSASEATYVRKILDKNSAYCAVITDSSKNEYGTYSFMRVRVFNKVPLKQFNKFAGSSENPALKAINTQRFKAAVGRITDDHDDYVDDDDYHFMNGSDERDFF
jgi:hypothetical protein